MLTDKKFSLYYFLIVKYMVSQILNSACMFFYLNLIFLYNLHFFLSLQRPWACAVQSTLCTLFCNCIELCNRKSTVVVFVSFYCQAVQTREKEEWKKGWVCIYLFFIFFGGLECVGHSFSYVAHLVFLRDVWSRTLRAAAASRSATNLATHLPY